MKKFLFPGYYDDVIVPMFGQVHMISIAVMFLLIGLLFWQKKAVVKLAENRRFMVWVMILFYIDEVFHWSNIWYWGVTPVIDRLPLHLCGTLAIIVPYLVLKEKYDTMRLFLYISFGSGFIAIINPGFGHMEPFSYLFIQYHIRHYFLVLIPVFLQISKGYKHDYREFMKTVLVLVAWGSVIFFFNWATGGNYMQLGQNNPTPITFLPENLTRWPVIFPTLFAVAIILLNLIYLGFSAMGRKCKPVKAILNYSQV